MALAREFGIVNFWDLDRLIGWDTYRDWMNYFALEAEDMKQRELEARAASEVSADLEGTRDRLPTPRSR